MAKRPLADFLGIHTGETAWLFGKGPSLRRFIDIGGMAFAGPVRGAINDVVSVVPDCLYGFSNDQVNQKECSWEDVYKPGQVLFTPERSWENTTSFGPARVACDVCAFPDRADAARATWSPEQRAKQGLLIREGTLGSALQVLYVMGIRRIVCVGIDGGQAHAEGVQWRTRLMNDHFRAYNRIRNNFIRDAERLGVDLDFFGKPHVSQIMKQANTIITRNTRSKGTMLRAGERITLDPAEQALLVQAGKARVLTAAEKLHEVPVSAPTLPQITPEVKAETPPPAPKKKAVRKTTTKPRKSRAASKN